MAITRTPEEEQVVRDNLIATCAKVFLRDGYSKVTMKSLADEAGCTTGKFYSNFAGKPEILRVLIEKLTRTAYRETLNLLSEPGDNQMEKLMLFFVMEYEICHINEKIRELFHFAYEDSEALAAVADFFKRQYLKIRDFKTHRYVRCPFCKAQLRLKKRTGVQQIHCPRCGEDFKKNILF